MKPLRASLGAFCVLALTGCVDRSAPPSADSALDVAVHEGTFATIQQFTTPKGISVWLVEEPSIPILSLRMAWPTGTLSDPDGLEGLTSSLVYQMNEGAGDLESQAFLKRMEELNMSFGCGADPEATYCNASMLTDNAEASFDLIGLAYSAPRFDEGPWQRFVRETTVSLETRQTNPSYLARRAQIDALYPDHRLARQLTVESLEALTVDAAKAHREQIMVQDGLIVTAVGAISPAALAPLIDGAIEALPRTGLSLDVPEVALQPAAEAPIAIDLPQPQSLVRFTAPGLAREDEDFYTAIVLNYTLGGGGFDSRLMQDLRVEKGLTYGVRTGLSSGPYLQLWSGGGQTRNETAGAFITGIKDNLQALTETGVTAEELEAAKAYLIGSYPLGFDSNAKIAANMMGVRLEGLPVDAFDTRNAKIEAVSLEDVNRVASTFLRPENFTFIVVGQPEGLD